jgi:hypothetical protein
MSISKVLPFPLVLLMVGLMAIPAHSREETAVITECRPEQLRFDRVAGFDRIVLEASSMLCRPGEPMLPARQIRVALPAGAEAQGIRASSLESQTLPGDYRVFPGQRPSRLNGDPPAPFVGPDEKIYGSAEPYPGILAVLDGQTDLAGQQMAVITVYPVQYVPASRRLILHREIEITVETRPGRISRERYAVFTDKERRIYEEMIADMVINPQDVVLNPPPGEMSKSLPAGQFDHVIITPSSYVSYFDDLVEWHNRRGLRDTVVTTEYIYANYSGSDDQEKIRSFVIDAHGTWGTIYFLMGGEDAQVPFEYRNYDSQPDDTPSDQYYADYDDDWTYEVYVGRLTGSDQEQFDTAIEKILKYEKDPPLTNYPLDILLVGMDLNASTPSENLKETIDGYIPSRFDVTKVYDSDSGNHKDATVAALNDGQNLFNHSDHANSTQMGLGYVNHDLFIGNYGVSQLTNDDRTTNVVSTGCWANDMTWGGIQDGIAEVFVIYNPQQAGVSFTGNTRDGWYTSGVLNTLTSLVDREWWKSLFNYDKYVLGQTLADSKNRNHPSYNLWRHCVWTFNLLGEPAMPLWTDTPAAITATHPATLPPGSSSFTVHAESGGSDLISAYVCLWKPGEVYLRQATDSNGDAVFTPNPVTVGSLYVTITKKNYLPYEGQALVTSGAPDPVSGLIAQPAAEDLVLTWSPPSSKTVVRYVIYRDSTGGFEAGPDDSIGGTIDTTYLDAGAIGAVGTNYYYIVKAVDDIGQKSDSSGMVGEYDVPLISTP